MHDQKITRGVALRTTSKQQEALRYARPANNKRRCAMHDQQTTRGVALRTTSKQQEALPLAGPKNGALDQPAKSWNATLSR